MRKSLFLLVSISFLLLVFAGNSFALKISVGDSIVIRDLGGSANAVYNGGTGGAFVATVNSDIQFLTFCAELNEEFYYDTTYTIGGLSTKTVASYKDLTPFAAWLYTQAVEGAYDNANLQFVQYAIWKEFDGIELGGTAAAFYNAQNTNFASSGWTGLGSVKVINMVYGDNNRQDMLVMVPEPGTALLLGGIFLGLGVLGRKQLLKR